MREVKVKASLAVILLLVLVFSLSLAESIVVAFEQKEYSILAGKNESIVPVIQGTKQKGKMVYTSSDESIATVNNGKVTGLKAGNVTISCTVTIGEETFTPSYELTVIQPVKKIEVTNKSFEMPSNCKTKEPVVHVLPEDASITELEFTSSNNKVATVSKDGILSTGSEGGTATITCKSKDGSNVKATFKVKVPKNAWFFEKKYVIDSPDGIDFYYKPTASFFLSDELCSNDSIRARSSEVSITDISEELPYVFTRGGEALRKVHITPQKTGKGKFVYDGFMVKKASVEITVNRSAVYEQVDYEKVMKNPEKNQGLQFYLKGPFVREEEQNGVRAIYLAFEKDESRPVKIVLPQGNKTDFQSRTLDVGVNGKFVGLEDYVSETGLTKQLPVFEADKIL